MNKGRSNRGRETEFILAEYLRSLYPGSYPTNKSAPGVDIANTGRLAFEAKATSALPLLGALRQAHGRAQPNDIPVIVWRPNGYGAARINEWVVATRLDTFFEQIAPLANYFRE